MAKVWTNGYVTVDVPVHFSFIYLETPLFSKVIDDCVLHREYRRFLRKKRRKTLLLYQKIASKASPKRF